MSREISVIDALDATHYFSSSVSYVSLTIFWHFHTTQIEPAHLFISIRSPGAWRLSKLLFYVVFSEQPVFLSHIFCLLTHNPLSQFCNSHKNRARKRRSVVMKSTPQGDPPPRALLPGLSSLPRPPLYVRHLVFVFLLVLIAGTVEAGWLGSIFGRKDKQQVWWEGRMRGCVSAASGSELGRKARREGGRTVK